MDRGDFSMSDKQIFVVSEVWLQYLDNKPNKKRHKILLVLAALLFKLHIQTSNLTINKLFLGKIIWNYWSTEQRVLDLNEFNLIIQND